MGEPRDHEESDPLPEPARQSSARGYAGALKLAEAPSENDEDLERGPDLKDLLEAYERSLILAALGTVGGRQRSAAALLRILPSTLHEKMKRLGIPPHRTQRMTTAARPGSAEVSAALCWKGRVSPGGTLELRGLNGKVRIEATEGDEIEVRATRRGMRAVSSAIEVKVVEHDGGVTICGVCQGLDPGTLRRLSPSLSRGVANVRVEFLARVPPGIHVVASTVNDDIEVVGLSGHVEAGTANGYVRFLPAPSSHQGLALLPRS
jgi:hypothetical protein